jgi:hypothetical protein
MPRFIVLHGCSIRRCRRNASACRGCEPKADKAALKRAVVACKAEAKSKKIKWLSPEIRQQFVTEARSIHI